MSTHKIAEFNRQLDAVFKRRTYWLRTEIGGRPAGAQLRFTKAKLDEAILKLQSLASEVIATDQAKKEFSDLVVKKKQWHIKGRGRPEKKSRFDTWISQNFNHRNLIYIFWNGRKCLYVGKTENGKGRPQDHFDKFWFSEATRIDIYAVQQKTQVLKLECLAKHRFLPSRNKIDPPTKKWYKKCPVCALHEQIYSEMRSIFGRK